MSTSNQVPNNHKPNVVVIDDDIEMRSMLCDFLNGSGYNAISYPLASQAFEEIKTADIGPQHLTESNIDLIVCDLNMPQMNGLEFIQRMKLKSPQLPVILITAFGSIESAIEATKAGAYDYIVKPFKLGEVAAVINRAIHLRNLNKENEILRSEVKKNWSLEQLIGKSRAMREVYYLVKKVAGAKANVLITGESGTGKEMIARAIHNQGPRSNKPFIPINCTAIPESLLESELFGHAKGSFTGAIRTKKGLFEEANGGTIFLDEIGDMDLPLQAKLLRVLQERKIKAVGSNDERDIDVRIIAATHKDLKKAIKEECFREDLYYRLSVIPIAIPPLRHRREDIPLLAEHFLKKYAAMNNSSVKGLTPDAINKLMQYRWEGNVRELENMMERIAVLCSDSFIGADELPLTLPDSVDEFFGRATSSLPTIEDLEKKYIHLVLEKTGGRKEKAAQILGINRRTLYRKEREYGFVDASPIDNPNNEPLPAPTHH